MRLRSFIFMVGGLSFFSPAVTLAVTDSCGNVTPTTFSCLVSFLVGYINILIPIVIALGVLAYMKNTASGIFKLQSGKVDPDWTKGLGWGILGLFMMVSLWGILSILTNTFF